MQVFDKESFLFFQPSALTLCALSFVMAIRHTDNKLKTEMVNTGILQWLCTKIDKTMNHVLDKEVFLKIV